MTNCFVILSEETYNKQSWKPSIKQSHCNWIAAAAAATQSKNER